MMYSLLVTLEKESENTNAVKPKVALIIKVNLYSLYKILYKIHLLLVIKSCKLISKEVIIEKRS